MLLFQIFRWTRFNGFALDQNRIEQKLKYQKPSMEELLYSNATFQDVFVKRNYVKSMEGSILYCAVQCLKMSACDMFDYDYDNEACSMLPHMSLKDESWETFSVKSPDNTALFVLHCSTALENIAVGGDYNTRSTDPGDWMFTGKDLQIWHHGHLENTIQLLSLSQYFLWASPDEIATITTTITEDVLPLGMNNDYLKAFGQVRDLSYYAAHSFSLFLSLIHI